MLLTEMIVKESLPLNLVESHQIAKFIPSFETKFKLRCQGVLKSRINQVYENPHETMKKVIGNVKSIPLTTGIGTDEYDN